MELPSVIAGIHLSDEHEPGGGHGGGRLFGYGPINRREYTEAHMGIQIATRARAR